MLDDRRVQRDRPVEARVHQVDAAARRVHLLAARARRSGTSAGRSRSGRSRRCSSRGSRSSASAEDAVRVELALGCARAAASTALVAPCRSAGSLARVGDARRGADDGLVDPGERVGEPARGEARRGRARRPGARATRPRLAAPPPRRRRGRAARELRLDRARRSLEEHRDAPRVEDVERARLRAGSEGAARRRPPASSVSTTSVRVGASAAGAAGSSRGRSARAVPREPQTSLREVVAGDVLHDLAAGAGDRAVREHERDAEDEVARRAEAVPQRARRGSVASSAPTVGSPGGSSESRCPCSAEAPRAASRAARRPRRCRSGRRPRARGRGRARRSSASSPIRDASRPSACAAAQERVGRLLEARDARQRRSSRAGARGTGPAPRRRGAASGAPCPGCRARPGRTRAAAARTTSRSRSENIRGIEHALSIPTPCSPVSEPPASRQASRIASASSAPAPSRRPPRRRGRAGGGCRRPRGRRCRRAGRGSPTAPRSAAAPPGSRVRGTTPSWT